MNNAAIAKCLAVTLCVYLFNTQAYASDALLSINNHVFNVELAVSEIEHHQGLMRRKLLAANNGMLFIYSEPQLLSFWMKETLIPLDLIFFNSDGELLEKIENIPPCQAMPCKIYANKQAAQYVLELSAGSASKFSLKTGDKFTILASE